MKQLFLFLANCLSLVAISQSIAINNDGSSANPSSLLDVKSSSKGMLIPRMSTAQRNAIAAPAKGLLVFDNDKNSFLFFGGIQWRGLLSGNTSGMQPVANAAPAAENTSRFGYAVSLSGNWAAISALQYEGPNVSPSGVVFLFQKNSSGTWTQQAKLTNPAADGQGFFGYSTDMDGDHLIVGAPYNKDDVGIRSGRVYLYQRSDNQWQLKASFIRPGGSSGNYFGYDVAIDVTASGLVRAAASAPNAAGFQGSAEGYVRLFKRQAGGLWQIDQDASFVGIRAGDQAGYSIDLEEDLLVAGAPGADQYSNNKLIHNNSGVVYALRFGANGLLNHEVKWSYGVADLYFGFSVAVSNGRVAVGAPYFGLKNNYCGAFVYHRYNNQWISSAVFEPFDLKSIYTSSHFGVSVALSGDKLLVGASGGLEATLAGPAYIGNTRPGQALLFQLRSINENNSMEIMRLSTYQSEVESNANYFGLAVALSGGSFILSDQNRSNSIHFKAGSVHFGSVE